MARKERRDKLIRLLAEVLDGLQVPATMTNRGPMLLGTAFLPYVEILKLLNVHVIEDQAKFIELLEKALSQNKQSGRR